MKKGVVVYKSKYGSTKRYAEWISEELEYDFFSREEVDSKKLNEYDVIIYGGGLYASKVNGIELITKSFNTIKDKKIILFTCGIADTNNDNNIEHIRESVHKVMTDEMQKNIKIFYLRGGIDYSELNFIHSLMMKMLIRNLKKKKYESLTIEDKEMLDSYGGKVEFEDKNSIEKILSYVRALS